MGGLRAFISALRRRDLRKGSWSLSKNLGVAAIIVAVALFYLGTIRDGLQGGGDYAMYVQHAKNLATGSPYAETGYIMNPHYRDLGPQSYPPGYPLLLAPIYRWRGVDLGVMKVQGILLFIAFLPLYFVLIRKELSRAYALVALLITGLCPVFWVYKENISSDFAFLPFLFAGLLLIDRHNRGKARRLPWLLFGLMVSLVVWSASAVRSLGLTVIPALLLLDVLRRRKISGFAVLVTVATGALVLLQGALFPGTGSSIDLLWPIDPGVVWYSAVKYVKAATAVWSNGYFPPLRVALFGLTGLAAVWSFVRRIRGQATIVETFIPFYVIAIIVFPLGSSRYLLPLIPLYVFYILLTFESVTSSLAPRARGSALAALVCIILAVYGARYTSLDYGPLEGPAKSAHTEDLFQYIRAATGETDVFVARRPRVLSLYTGRSASVYHQASDDDLWSYFEHIGADYLVSGPEDTDGYRAFIERSADRLEVTHENPQFTVLAVDWTEDLARSPAR